MAFLSPTCMTVVPFCRQSRSFCTCAQVARESHLRALCVGSTWLHTSLQTPNEWRHAHKDPGFMESMYSRFYWFLETADGFHCFHRFRFCFLNCFKPCFVPAQYSASGKSNSLTLSSPVKAYLSVYASSAWSRFMLQCFQSTEVHSMGFLWNINATTWVMVPPPTNHTLTSNFSSSRHKYPHSRRSTRSSCFLNPVAHLVCC